MILMSHNYDLLLGIEAYLVGLEVLILCFELVLGQTVCGLHIVYT
jgi:hypothetical protein